MTFRFAGTATAVTAWLLISGTTLAAQATATVDAGASWVDYEGFLPSGAFVLTPTLRYDTPDLSLGASGTYVKFESSRHIVQGLAAGAWRASLNHNMRAEFSGSAGVNAYADNPGYGHLLGRTRIHYVGRLSGAWIGGATGHSYQGSASHTPYEIELGGWTVYQGFALGAVAKQTWGAGLSYLDAVATARWRDRFLEITGSLGTRGWSTGAGEGVYGEIHAQVPVSRQISVLVSGGRYPSDTVRGVVPANYVSVGLRVNAFKSPTSTTPTPLRALFRELERPGSPSRGEARLTIETSLRDLHTIRIEAPGARSVELTGDFTDWQPVSLHRVSGATWEVTVRASAGVHRINVRLDDGRWIVPHGLRAEQDDYGGMVGVLVVR